MRANAPSAFRAPRAVPPVAVARVEVRAEVAEGLHHALGVVARQRRGRAARDVQGRHVRDGVRGRRRRRARLEQAYRNGLAKFHAAGEETA